MKMLYDLSVAGGIEVEQFKEFNTLLWERLGRLSTELPKIECESAALAVGGLSVEIDHEARNLAALWPTLDVEEKQRLAATICTEIIVPNKDSDAPIKVVFAHSAPKKLKSRFASGQLPQTPLQRKTTPKF